MNETSLDYDEDYILGGQGLVEAVFSGMFDEEFDGVMPIRNHKVRESVGVACRGSFSWA